jgi:hypothetical protein
MEPLIKSAVYKCWLVYSLGIQGDYTALFELLDRVDAKDCGPNCAYFKLGPGSLLSLSELEAQFSQAGGISGYNLYGNQFYSVGDYIYLIYQDGETGLTSGKFLLGERSQAPIWAGYSKNKHALTSVSEID